MKKKTLFAVRERLWQAMITTRVLWVSGFVLGTVFAHVNTNVESRYETVVLHFGGVTPRVLLPSSDRAQYFSKVVSEWNGIVAVSSHELFADYDYSKPTVSVHLKTMV